MTLKKCFNLSDAFIECVVPKAFMFIYSKIWKGVGTSRFILFALGSPHSKWPLRSSAFCESIQFQLNQAYRKSSNSCNVVDSAFNINDKSKSRLCNTLQHI